MCRIKSLHDNKMAAKLTVTSTQYVMRTRRTLALLPLTLPAILKRFLISFAKWRPMLKTNALQTLPQACKLLTVKLASLVKLLTSSMQYVLFRFLPIRYNPPM